MYRLEMSKRVTINTDPQRRCYNGCHYSSKTVWSEWAVLETNIPLEKTWDRLKFWRDLNAYSVSVGGTPAQYRVEEQE